MPVKITVRDNGPLRIEGDDFSIYDSKDARSIAHQGGSLCLVLSLWPEQYEPFAMAHTGRCGFAVQVEMRRVLPPPPPTA